MFFSDEKIFTVAPPVNLQNDRVSEAVKKREVDAERLTPAHETNFQHIV